MRLSELKKIVDEAYDYFTTDEEVNIFNSSGDKIQPVELAWYGEIDAIIFDED